MFELFYGVTLIDLLKFVSFSIICCVEAYLNLSIPIKPKTACIYHSAMTVNGNNLTLANIFSVAA